MGCDGPSRLSHLQNIRGKDKRWLVHFLPLRLSLSLPLPLPFPFPFKSLLSSVSLGILKPPISFLTTVPRHQAWSWKRNGKEYYLVCLTLQRGLFNTVTWVWSGFYLRHESARHTVTSNAPILCRTQSSSHDLKSEVLLE